MDEEGDDEKDEEVAAFLALMPLPPACLLLSALSTSMAISFTETIHGAII